MKEMVKLVFLFLLVTLSGGVSAQKPSQTSTGKVELNGKPLLAVGVNYFDAVGRSLVNPKDRSYIEGLAYLERFKIPFVRVNFGGFWPSDFKLYRRDREAYFRIIGDFLDEAEKRGVGVVATVAWNYAAIPDVVGEPVNAWGDRNSKTNQFMSEYASELARRFGARNSIWMWEFGNEISLNADLPNAAEFRPAVRLENGTPSFRSARDEISAHDVSVALGVFKQAIRRFDAKTVLSTGQALPRPYAYNNSSNKSWQSDSKKQFCSVLVRDNPVGYGVMSVHVYEDPKQRYFGGTSSDVGEIASVVTDCADRHKQAVFVGEFGFDQRKYSMPDRLVKVNSFLSMVDRLKVPLAALWVFDYKYQNDSFNIDRLNGAPWLSTIAKFNERRSIEK